MVVINRLVYWAFLFLFITPPHSNAFSSSHHRHIAKLQSFLLRSTTQDITSQSISSQKRKKGQCTEWIACSSTKELTRAIEMYVQEGDVVAELGSQLRESSTTLCEAIGREGKAKLVDIERKFPNEKKDHKRTTAMRRKGDENDFYSDRATFVELPNFDLWRHALFFNDYTTKPQYNVFIVDMSTVAGNDLELTCISLIKEFIALNIHNNNQQQCRAVLVKSASLQNLARRLYHAQQIISGAQTLPDDQRWYNSGHSSIIGAVGVKQYRELIPYVVRRGDVCIEIGCHLGTSTTLIDAAAEGNDSQGGCLGVDVGSHIILSARKKYPHLKFEVGDGFKTGELARMKDLHFGDKSGNVDVVFVDIGGLSGSEGLLEAVALLASISNSLEPRCIVIKSLCIRRLSSCLIPFSEIWRKDRLSDRRL